MHNPGGVSCLNGVADLHDDAGPLLATARLYLNENLVNQDKATQLQSIFQARQMVSHGHVTVNGRRVTVPSYRCKPGDIIEVKEKARQLPLVLEAIKSPERDVPDYVEADHNKMVAKLVRVPVLSDVPYPVHMEPNLVVEFYSR